jgi:hypothetical protein
MTRRSGEEVTVTLSSDSQDSQPIGFDRRGRHYEVSVIARWSLTTRWWAETRRADREYYRVATEDHQIFDLFYERVSEQWVLDTVLD